MTNSQRLPNDSACRSQLSKLGLRVLFMIVACSQFPLPIAHSHELGQVDNDRYGNSLMPAGLTDHLDRYHGNQFWLSKTSAESNIHWHVHFLMPWQLGIDCSRALVDADSQTTDFGSMDSNGLAAWLGYCDLTSQDQDLPVVLDYIASAVLFVSFDEFHSPPCLFTGTTANCAASFLGSFASVSHHALLCVLRC